MSVYSPESLTAAVEAICPDIRARLDKPAQPLDERRLWWELSSCILSSQVPYNLAVAAADAIDEEGLLFECCFDSDELMRLLLDVLTSPLLTDGRFRLYRFPVARARHLAATRMAVSKEAYSLRKLLEQFHDAAGARAWLVKHAPGVGPKQASMFLRNVGISYDLAVLDRHVLDYMSALGIYPGVSTSIAGLAQYRQHEVVLRDHADDLDCPVGILDWAIWIVMRVANRKMEPTLA